MTVVDMDIYVIQDEQQFGPYSAAGKSENRFCLQCGKVFEQLTGCEGRSARDLLARDQASSRG
jgi:hypothetical protein